MALTERGDKLLAYAQNILQLNDKGVRAVTQTPLQGRLRLGITEYFAPQGDAFVEQFAGHGLCLSESSGNVENVFM